MRTRRLAQWAVAAVGLIAFVSGGDVAASTPECLRNCVDGGDASGSGSVGARAEVFSQGSTERSRAVSTLPTWLAACSWTRLVAGGEVPAEFGDEVFANGVDEDSWVVTCPTDSILAVGFGDVATGIIDVYADGEPPAPQLVDAVRTESLQQVPLVAFNPRSAPAGTAEGPLVTRLPTLLWVEETEWVPVTATASIPGLTVTATATPSRAVWSGGDVDPGGGCEPGVPHDPAVAWDDQNFDCSTVFFHSSTVRDYELQVEVTWEKTWECSAFCGSGTAGSDVTIGSRAVVVGEVQALVQCWGQGCNNYDVVERATE